MQQSIIVLPLHHNHKIIKLENQFISNSQAAIPTCNNKSSRTQRQTV
jgi:hypothetical protein